MSELNRIKLLELAVQAGATIQNATKVASDWEQWANDDNPLRLGVPSPPVDDIEVRMKLISPQLKALFGKLNTFSPSEKLCIENSEGKRFEIYNSEGTVDATRDAIMQFPVELLSDTTWVKVGEPENPGKK